MVWMINISVHFLYFFIFYIQMNILSIGSKGDNKSNDDAKSSTSSLSPNANKNENKGKKKKNDIRGAFAKAQEIKNEEKKNPQSQIEEAMEKQQKLSKKKKAGKINNFFNTEAEEKQEAKSKKKAPTKTKKKGKEKKNEKLGSIQPARKRKRGICHFCVIHKKMHGIEYELGD